jgi:G3E family GTPase
LPSGCVCCTLKADLITTIEKIIVTFAPEHLIIEPSGIASPSGVLEALDLLRITPVMVIGIVDATEFIDLYEAEIYGSFFQDQVASSDVILINKADLADEDRITKTLILSGRSIPVLSLFVQFRQHWKGLFHPHDRTTVDTKTCISSAL